MRVKRSRGALSGLVLIVFGAWVALVPFVGPLFDYSIGPTSAWTWTAGRLWLNVLPGAAVVIAGIVVLGAGRRGSLAVASWVATVAGLWIVVAPEVSRAWNNGAVQSGGVYGGTHRQIVETLGYSLLSGAVIAAIGAFSLGRVSLATVQDVRYDTAVREQELRATQPEPVSVQPERQPEPVTVQPERQPEPVTVQPERQPDPVRADSESHHSMFRREHSIDLGDQTPPDTNPAPITREDTSDPPDR